MSVQKIFTAAVFSAVIGFTSCKKDNNGSSGYAYKLTTSNRSGALARTDAGAITWTSGTAFANLLKFEAKSSSGSEVEYKTPVSQQVDIFSSLASSLGNVSVPAGTYSEIEFKAFLTPGNGSAALEINGSFTSGSVTTPVTFTVNSAVELKSEMHSVTVSSSADYTALTTLNLARLTQGVTEAMLNAATKTNGKIIISSSSNTSIYNILLSNLDNSDEVEFEHD